MALKDLFTSSELEDGLTSVDRVKEVIESMQKEKDCVIENVGDVSEQWCSVANVIAITESNECLDLFIQSNGLLFIDKWLNEVEKSENKFFEESTTAFLKALDKLQVNNRALVSSAVGTTVENLIGHDNSVVSGKAKELWDKLVQVQETETPCEDKINNEEVKAEEALVLSPDDDDDNVVETDVKSDVKEDEEVTGSSVAGASQDSPGPQIDSSTEREKSPDTAIEKESEPIGDSPKESEKVFPGFDLNEELCSEETDDPVDLSVVSVSKAAAPLQFEGTLGWKGSAATSAFRRISESSVSGNSKGCNNLDLNASGGEESSVDASPHRSARLQLDLNSIGDVPDQRRQSPSQSSSSCSMQPSMQNIDLNMNEQSFISLFGAQVHVNHNDVGPKANRLVLEPPGWGVGSAYGYNPTLLFPSSYGQPMPYMVDTRVVGHRVSQQPPLLPLLTMNHSGFMINEGSFVNRQHVSGNQSSQASSVLGEKRKEPDGGWDTFPGNYKH